MEKRAGGGGSGSVHECGGRKCTGPLIWEPSQWEGDGTGISMDVENRVTVNSAHGRVIAHGDTKVNEEEVHVALLGCRGMPCMECGWHGVWMAWSVAVWMQGGALHGVRYLQKEHGACPWSAVHAHGMYEGAYL